MCIRTSDIKIYHELSFKDRIIISFFPILRVNYLKLLDIQDSIDMLFISRVIINLQLVTFIINILYTTCSKLSDILNHKLIDI